MAEYENGALGANQQDNEEQGLQLADIWGMIWNNRWWYIISVAICLFLALLYIYKTPNTYSQIEKIIIDERSEQSTFNDCKQNCQRERAADTECKKRKSGLGSKKNTSCASG